MAPAECLQFLRRAMADPQALPVLIVGTKRIAHLEWSFRELGAAAFFAKRIPGHEMASLCRASSGLPPSSGHSMLWRSNTKRLCEAPNRSGARSRHSKSSIFAGRGRRSSMSSGE